MQLTGKVVLVTGAQQGIGRAMTREFAAAGADVAINWLDDDGAAQRVAHEVRTQGRRAILVQADVSRIEQVKAMVLAAQEGLGPIDTLINNAGVFPRVPFLEMTEHDWDQVLNVNLKGSCFCAQEAAKAMVAAGRQDRSSTSPRAQHYAARLAVCITWRAKVASCRSRGRWRWSSPPIASGSMRSRPGLRTRPSRGMAAVRRRRGPFSAARPLRRSANRSSRPFSRLAGYSARVIRCGPQSP